jgi:hypothetical protein
MMRLLKSGLIRKKYTWWIDLGVTIHIKNSIQGFITRRTLQRGERSIRVTNDVEAEVETMGKLLLELNNGFILHLHNVLYVPYLSKNLISVSCLDDDGFDCQFDNKKYLIIKLLVLPSDKTSFICCPCMRM